MMAIYLCNNESDKYKHIFRLYVIIGGLNEALNLQ